MMFTSVPPVMFTYVLPMKSNMYMSHDDTVSGILLVLRPLLS